MDSGPLTYPTLSQGFSDRKIFFSVFWVCFLPIHLSFFFFLIYFSSILTLTLPCSSLTPSVPEKKKKGGNLNSNGTWMSKRREQLQRLILGSSSRGQRRWQQDKEEEKSSPGPAVSLSSHWAGAGWDWSGAGMWLSKASG